jgi:hypothetical protein
MDPWQQFGCLFGVAVPATGFSSWMSLAWKPICCVGLFRTDFGHGGTFE